MKRLTFRSILLISLLPLLFFQNQFPSNQAAASPFTFTAVGDYAATTNTSAVLDTIAASGAPFHLALGDLSYGAIQPDSAWCDYVKSHVGSQYPFELLAGNHDSGQIAS